MKKKNIFKIIAIVLFILGVLCIIIKGFTPEYVDSNDVLHEYFFLLPIGFGLIILSIISFIIAFIKNSK